jgi:hypothetical protein
MNQVAVEEGPPFLPPSPASRRQPYYHQMDVIVNQSEVEFQTIRKPKDNNSAAEQKTQTVLIWE